MVQKGPAKIMNNIQFIRTDLSEMVRIHPKQQHNGFLWALHPFVLLIILLCVRTGLKKRKSALNVGLNKCAWNMGKTNLIVCFWDSLIDYDLVLSRGRPIRLLCMHENWTNFEYIPQFVFYRLQELGLPTRIMQSFWVGVTQSIVCKKSTVDFAPTFEQ